MTATNTPKGTGIDGAIALVTGGQRGFGRALVDELLDRGASKVYDLPHRGQRLPPGNLQSSQILGRTTVVRHRVLERSRPRRALRGHGATRDLRQGAAQRISQLAGVRSKPLKG
jgi:NAD(P)-dependent dehydrogenase (short-subunit alcohol dehydrogenase family)